MRGKSVKPTESAVFVVKVLALAFELDVLGLFGGVTGLCLEGLGAGEGEDGVQAGFEERGPGKGAAVGEMGGLCEGEFEGLLSWAMLLVWISNLY